MPLLNERITLDTWPDADPANLDKYYPIVFGTPGVYDLPDGTPAEVPGSPAYKLVNGGTGGGKVLIAGHEVAASEVTLIGFHSFGTSSNVLNVQTEVDPLGTVISTVQSSTIASPGDRFFVIWNRLPIGTAVGSGGLINDRRNGDRTGAGEVMTYFFRRSTIKQDVGRWRAIENYLDQRFKLAGFVSEARSPWEYIKDNILPLVPVSLIASSDGLAPVLWRRDAKKSDAVAHLTAGPNLSRVGRVSYAKQDIINEIRLGCAPRADE